MGDVKPPVSVVFGQGNRISKHLTVSLDPEFAYSRGRKLPLISSFAVQVLLEPCKYRLSEDRGHYILEFFRYQNQPAFPSRFFLLEAVKHEHFRKDACGLSSGKRRVGLKITLSSRKILVHAVAKLVSQNHHVSRFPGVVHKNIGVYAGNRTVAESASSFPVPKLGVYPVFLEKRRRGLFHLG